MSGNSGTPPISENTQLHYPHPGNIGNALSGVKMMGELGRGAVALRDVIV